MGLLDSPTPAQAAADRIRQGAKALFAANVIGFNNLMRTMWQTRNVTSQEIFAELGTDGADIVANAEALKAFLNDRKPGTITATAPMQMEVDSAGNVTLSPLPSSSESSGA